MRKITLKRSILLLVAVSVIMFPAPNAFANESETKVIISPEAKNIPNYVIEQIIEENPDAGVINIYEYGDIIDTNKNSKQNIIINPLDKIIDNESYIISPAMTVYTVYRNIKTSRTVINSEREAKDEFKFSVAKGEVVELSVTYKGQLKGSYTGVPISVSELGVSATISGEYKKGTRYSGPLETSDYNSREFRMKFFELYGRYTQTAQKVTYLSSGIQASSVDVSESGTYTEPTRYLSYSVDRKIKQ